MALYHKTLGFPHNLSLPKGIFSLVYSQHALEAANTDRNGKINLEGKLNIDPYRVFEVETNHKGELVKVLYRTRHDVRNDVIFALNVSKESMVVRTVWLNRRDDKHKTLDRNKYQIPGKVA